MRIFTRLSKAMIFVALASLLQHAHAAQSVSGIVNAEMKPGESDQQFVQRIAKGDLIKAGRDQPQIARTSKLLEDKQVLVAFTTTPETEDETQSPDPNSDIDITLNVFIKNNGQSYAYLEPIVACEAEGGPADLRTFFYANVAGESRPLLGAICGWDAYHALVDCVPHDEIRFFKITEIGIMVVPMDKYQAALYSKGPAISDPKFSCTISKFHTAADVKRLLSKFETKAQSYP